MSKKEKRIYSLLFALYLVFTMIFQISTISYASESGSIMGDNPEIVLFKMVDEDNQPVSGIVGMLTKRNDYGPIKTISVGSYTTNENGEMILPARTIDNGSYYMSFLGAEKNIIKAYLTLILIIIHTKAMKLL